MPYLYLSHRLFAENAFDSIQAIHETTRTTRSLLSPFRVILWIVLDAMSVNAALLEFGHCRNAKARLTGSSALRYSSLPIRPNKPFWASTVSGAVAQLGERMTGSHEVRGSIPLGSTNICNNLGHTILCPFVKLCAYGVPRSRKGRRYSPEENAF